MSWIWGTVQTSLDGRRTWNIFLEHTVVLSVIFRTSFPSDDLHFTQYRVYWKPMFTAWIVEQSQSRSNVHHWEIWCRVPQQPLDNLARNECTPCQHWGQLTTKNFKSVTNGSSLVTHHGSGTCQEPVARHDEIGLLFQFDTLCEVLRKIPVLDLRFLHYSTQENVERAEEMFVYNTYSQSPATSFIK